MLTLYPPISPYSEYKITVDDVHTLHVEECGTPNGVPVIFLHGGPGAGCSTEHRRFFDPSVYRIILFDQRGCGRSTPHACLENNTIQELVKDMELIREYCKVDKWLLFGGSWGSTLALYYAQLHPQRVSAMILRGIFLCRSKDINWFYQEGASRVYPEEWKDFISHVSENKRDNIVQGYYELLTGDDDVARMSAAKAWSRWEAVCSTLDPNPHVVEFMTEPHIALGMAIVESYYFINKIFLKNEKLLSQVEKLHDIPGVIVHGRYDMVCPVDNAYELSRLWPQAKLEVIRDAGHSAFEPGIVDALIHATNSFAL